MSLQPVDLEEFQRKLRRIMNRGHWIANCPDWDQRKAIAQKVAADAEWLLQQTEFMKCCLSIAARDTSSAANDSATASQPLTAFPRFWRRVASIWHRNQAPVSGFQPDQKPASSSSDLARNSAAVKFGVPDIESFLVEVEARLRECPDVSMGPVEDLSPLGHVASIDAPKLVCIIRQIQAERMKPAANTSGAERTACLQVAEIAAKAAADQLRIKAANGTLKSPDGAAEAVTKAWLKSYQAATAGVGQVRWSYDPEPSDIPCSWHEAK